MEDCPLTPGGPQPHIQRRGGGGVAPRHGGVGAEGGLSQTFSGTIVKIQGVYLFFFRIHAISFHFSFH